MLTFHYRSRQRDEEIANELDKYEENGTLANRWNGPMERETRSANRRAANHSKGKAREKLMDEYQSLAAELDIIDQNKKQSLDRDKAIDIQLREIQIGGSSSPGLMAERDRLRSERKQGQDRRREWMSQKREIKVKIDAMKDAPVKLGRVHGNRPRSSPIILDDNGPRMSPSIEDWASSVRSDAPPQDGTQPGTSNENEPTSSPNEQKHTPIEHDLCILAQGDFPLASTSTSANTEVPFVDISNCAISPARAHDLLPADDSNSRATYFPLEEFDKTTAGNGFQGFDFTPLLQPDAIRAALDDEDLRVRINSFLCNY